MSRSIVSAVPNSSPAARLKKPAVQPGLWKKEVCPQHTRSSFITLRDVCTSAIRISCKDNGVPRSSSHIK
ncbi:uncharacterized protein EAF01_000218 [Botrytis porri]|uniref:Uncharacterized protein n=1 Tax=Botrytis porri TaxID=87229 RepID=A0A4Z1KRF7_9HELO|nr:uncharacterized protein EAF01_000218 [Botrytis porri]KAF7913812.1 hypothetical protein EAF01_000218 [Botrytis porri]TGO86964.1 hypothetical protein BPOR_0263g00090 [Botrytis porri]